MHENSAYGYRTHVACGSTMIQIAHRNRRYVMGVHVYEARAGDAMDFEQNHRVHQLHYRP